MCILQMQPYKTYMYMYIEQEETFLLKVCVYAADHPHCGISLFDFSGCVGFEG